MIVSKGLGSKQTVTQGYGQYNHVPTRKASWYTVASEWDVDSTLYAKWHITENIGQPKVYSWHIFNSVSNVLSYSWNIWGYVNQGLSYSWAVLNNVSKDLVYEWSITDSLSGKIRATFSAVKNAREYFGFTDIKGEKKKSRMR